MRIIFIVRGLYPDFRGGAPLYLYNLIKHLSVNSNLKIDVVHPGESYSLNGINNIKEYSLNSKRSKYYYYIRVQRFFNNMDSKYDLGFSDGFSAIMLLNKLDFPIIYHHHAYRNLQYWDYKTYFRVKPTEALKTGFLNLIKNIATNYMLKKCSYVVSQGEGITNLLINKMQLPSYKLINAPAPATNKLENDYKKNNNQNIFLSIGGLHFYKGWTYLIDAFNTMDNEAQLYIVGEGPLKKYLTKNSINNNVKFFGYVDKKTLLDLYLKSTCFIFPTLSEGSPSVLGEALSFGLPIIATNVGGTGQFLNNNNSFIVKPADYKEIIYSVNKFISLPKPQKIEMGLNSRKLFDSLPTWSSHASNFYNHLIKIHKSKK